MFSDNQKKQMLERQQDFISEVLYINDASLEETIAAGWRSGKLLWLTSACKHYRADSNKILGD